MPHQPRAWTRMVWKLLLEELRLAPRRKHASRWSAVCLVLLTPCSVLAQGGEVTLPLRDYRDLLERAEVEPSAVVEPAAQVSLEAVQMNIELTARSATVDQTLQLVIWSPGWQEIPLPASDRVIELDLAEPLEGRLHAVAGVLRVRGEGRHQVRLRQAFDLESLDGATRRQRVLALSTPHAAFIRGSLRDVDPAADGDTLELLDGGAPLQRSDRAIDFVAAPGRQLRIRALGENPATELDDAPLRFSTQTLTRLRWSPTAIDARLEVSTNVLQGRLEELRLVIAPDFEVVGVRGSGAIGEVEWRVEGPPDGAPVGRREGDVLVLRPPNALRGSGQFAITLRAPATAELDSPDFPVLQTLRQRQLITWEVVGDGLLEQVERGGLIEMGGGEASGLSTPLYQLSADGTPGRWRVLWPEKTEVLALRVDELFADLLVGVDGRALYSTRFLVAHRGSQVLEVQMPEGFELVRAERDGDRTRPGRLASGRLVLPLDPSAEQHRFQVVGVLPVMTVDRAVEAGGMSLPLPAASAPIARVVVRAQLPDGWTWRLADRDRASARAVGSTADLLQVAPGFEEIGAAWSAVSAQPSALRLEVEERRRREDWL